MRFLLAPLFGLMTAVGGEAAEFSLQDTAGEITEISLSGEIVRGDVERFDAILHERGKDGGRVRLNLNSPGGNLLVALDMADIVHGEGMQTYVSSGARCESACSILFMAGSSLAKGQSTPDRLLHPAGRLGFHAPVFPGTLFAKDGSTAIDDLGILEVAILQAASRFYGLMDAHQWQPSLVRATLSANGPGEMIYVETVGQAGRWFIRLDVEQPLLVLGGIAAAALCTNIYDWISDGAIATTAMTPSYQDFLPGARTPAVTQGVSSLKSWADGIDEFPGFEYANGDGRRLGIEGMSDSCIIDTSNDGAILDITANNDRMSQVIIVSTMESEYRVIRPAMDGRYFTWHLLPPFTKLSELESVLQKPPLMESMWDHNGSTMYLTRLADGSPTERWRIHYMLPKLSLEGRGVSQGTLLFKGEMREGSVSGEARTFRANCLAANYAVTGQADETEFVLQGAAPVRAEGKCEVLGYREGDLNGRLAFTRRH